MKKAIDRAIKLAGSQSALAKVLQISPQALGVQVRNGRILPGHCITIEKSFPGQISRYELDPEHFGAMVPRSDCVVIVLQNFQTTSKFV